MQSKDWADRRKALDPSVYRIKQYVMNIQCSTAIGGVGGGAVTIDNTPFVLDTITHGLFAFQDSQQDGNYTLLFRENQTVYNSQPAMAQALYGSCFGGNSVIPLPLRMFFRGSSTLNMDMVNYTNRGGAGSQFFTLQIVFHGFERWDSPRE